MDELVNEFNETVGAEEGIYINVTSISGSSIIHEKLQAAANGDPGASELPDIVTCYPKTAVLLKNKEKLAELSSYFSQEELSLYVEDFLEEGYIEEELYVFSHSKINRSSFC